MVGGDGEDDEDEDGDGDRDEGGGPAIGLTVPARRVRSMEDMSTLQPVTCAISRSREAMREGSLREVDILEYRILHISAGRALKRRLWPVRMGRTSSLATGAVGAILLIRSAERRG